MSGLRHGTLVAALALAVAAAPLAGQDAGAKKANDAAARETPAPITAWTPPPGLGPLTDVSDAQANEPFCCDSRELGVTLIEIGAAMVIPWYFNRHVSDDSTAVIGPDTWWANVEEGFEWDHDNFKTNMFAHPYHGGLYFNAGRSNGYNFWESAAWAWGGSFLWEMFGENNRGAINDWLATAVGGIAIGEALHRASVTVWDNEATGTERALREIGGFFINPMGGASRLFRGEMSRTGANPDDRFPASVRTNLNGGFRHVGDAGADPGTDGWVGQFELDYGNPLRDFENPFDAFTFRVQLNGGEDERIGLFQIRGGLWGTELRDSPQVRHTFRLEQLFHYINNRTTETGGSAVAASFNSHWSLSDTWGVGTRVAPTALLLWGVASEYADFTRRTYDFGTGFGLILGSDLRMNGTRIVGVDWASLVQKNLSGASGTVWQHYLITRASYPIVGRFGIGGEYWLFIRDSNYTDFPDVYRRHPEVLLYLTWDTSEGRFR
ncbi:MAG: DUF3943 domain-containing protein [Gemmatimonadota bacterium]|nr:DUF3943 domain-containing protein [Gemmatimonadota bacterium]